MRHTDVDPRRPERWQAALSPWDEGAVKALMRSQWRSHDLLHIAYLYNPRGGISNRLYNVVIEITAIARLAPGVRVAYISVDDLDSPFGVASIAFMEKIYDV